jgi:hypothetical protein
VPAFAQDKQLHPLSIQDIIARFSTSATLIQPSLSFGQSPTPTAFRDVFLPCRAGCCVIKALPRKTICVRRRVYWGWPGGGIGWNCPEVSAHRDGECHRRHRIGINTFTSLVQVQLGRTLDQDCEPLGKQCARWNLFKITLASHGYTFVGKGTISVFVEDL